MRKEEIPQHEIRLITNLYWDKRAIIRTEKGITKEVEIKKGVRQGCILSPILFNLYSECLIREAIEGEPGLKINGKNINNIRFADDTAIIAENEEDLQNLLNKITLTCEEYGMALNVKKTKTMVIDKKNSIVTNIYVNGEKLEQVKKYKYLGSWITEDGKCTEEVKNRTGQAKAEF